MVSVFNDTSRAPLVLLSGGGGGARLAAGLSQASGDRPLLVITNTGDDFEHCGLTICPDTDSVLYAVSKTIDPQRGWGRAEESWWVFEALKNLGGPDWFQLGDKDLALHLSRAALLAAFQFLAAVVPRGCLMIRMRGSVSVSRKSRLASVPPPSEKTMSKLL